MSKRKRIFGLAAFAVLLTTVIAGFDVYLSPRSEVEAYKAELRARGEKLTVEELVPPPIPPEENNADAVDTAFTMLSGRDFMQDSNPPPSAMKMVAPGKAMIGWAQLDVRSWNATNTWDNVALTLAGNSNALAMLRQVIERPKIDFQPDYKAGSNIKFSNLSKLRVSTLDLMADTVFDLHNGDSPSAVGDVRTALALVRGTDHDRLLINQLVGDAMASSTVSATWELLQAANLNDPELASVQKDWEELDLVDAYEKSVSMERARADALIENLRTSGGHIRSLMSGYTGPSGGSGDWLEELKGRWQDVKGRGKEIAWLVAWSRPDQLRMLKGYQALLDCVRSASTNQAFRAALLDQTNRLNKLGIQTVNDFSIYLGDSDFKTMFSSGVISSSGCMNRLIVCEAARRIVVTAIALKRYELKNGRYPATLSELIPGYLKIVPLDPIDGKPLRYRLGSDGSFVLYSIGDDGIDNGGDGTPVDSSKYFSWQRSHDWVWPMPATKAEIEKYYVEQSSKPK